MIYTLTLNPCTDKTVTVDSFEIGGTNRILSYVKNTCGKGINTSVVIHNLGRDVCAFLFDFSEGGSVPSYLTAQGIMCRSVHVPGELRTNVKIYDRSTGITTEINEKGETTSALKANEIYDLISGTVSKGDVMVISGSVPPGVPVDFYYQLIVMLKSRGVYTILDADGDLLSSGIKSLPDMIKPNRDELSRLLGRDVRSIDDSVSAARELCNTGIGAVCVSLGKDGAIFVRGDKCFRAVNDIKEVKGTVGAGDSMVAGFAIGVSEGSSDEETLRMASAAAAGSVSLPSTDLCTPELYREMYSRVTVTELQFCL